MSYKQLFLLTEGSSDTELFEQIIKPRLADTYYQINIISTSSKSQEYVRNLLQSLPYQNSDYWKINDIDSSPCFTQKKETIQSKYPVIMPDRILIVVKEIEGWYSAGLTNEACLYLNVQFDKIPEKITKEDFVRCKPSHYISVKAFMQDILNHFDFDEAKRNSSSFAYCMAKLGL